MKTLKKKIPNKIIWVGFFRRETEDRSGYRNHSYFYLGLIRQSV
jgi:hypothetical protein